MPNKTPLQKEYADEAIDQSLEQIATETEPKPEAKKQSPKAKDLILAVKSRNILNQPTLKPIFLSVSEAARLSGIGNKTIRRAIEDKSLRFVIKQNRYFIDITSLVRFMLSTTKRKNRFNTDGIGQYVDKWKE